MPDYNFAGLSTRSFEQLVQALSTKLLGPNTVVFGDGPDGGREATYEGPTSYPSGSQVWNGYVVIQAKFRQRPESVAKDAAWALAQLSAELSKFQSRKRHLRRPEYYIFATNVTLTPVYKTGSKDRAYLRLNKLKEGLSIKGFDIWDQDKLRTFLDNSEDLRRAYGAWITPGDVLADLASKLDLKQPRFDEILTNFLQKELLADRYANLEQAGHTVEERVPLATVFVDLPAGGVSRTEPPDDDNATPGFVQEVLEAARERFDSDSLAHTIRAGVGMSGLGARLGRYVLVGGPGQGKTTLGQFVCQLFRTSILRQKPRKVLSPDTSDAMKEIEDQCQSEELSIPLVRRFPIRIVLSELAARLDNQPESLLAYIANRIQKVSGKSFGVDDFRRWLGSYPWALVLDGLDEVPASSNREELLNAIRDFWVDVADCAADILVIATTRPQGYNDDFSPKFYEHRYLAPLSDERALHYARRLVDVRYESEETRKKKILDRLERACRGGSPTSRLMRSPLQVTIMATLVDRVGQPPQERWNLFKDYYTVIYEREIERDTPAASLLRNYQTDINTIHARVGLLLQIESEKTGSTDARLPLDRFRTIVEARLVEEGHVGKGLHDLEEQLMTAAMHRLVFLVGLEQKQIGFEVRSLQEFMAAEGLMQGQEDHIPARLRTIAPISHWRNVFLFAAGRCFAERQHLRDTIHTICSQLNEGSDPAAESVLAGSQLAIDLLEDGSARRQPKYALSLFRIGFQILDLPPTEYQTKLAALYSPDIERLFSAELRKRLSSKNYADQLGAWNCLSAMNSRITFVSKLRDENWPTDKSESFQTVRYAGNPQDIFERLVPLIPSFSPETIWGQYAHRLSVYGRDLKALKRQNFPDWFYVVNGYFTRLIWGGSRNEIILRIPETRAEQVVRTGIACFTGGQINWLIPIKEMPHLDSTWQLLVSAAAFLENPTHLGLATQLERLAEYGTAGYRRPLMAWVPWVLNACTIDRSPKDLVALAGLVREGEVGDFSAWREAEQRWVSKGVTLGDIEHRSDPFLPFDRHIGRIGFPLEARTGLIGGSDPVSLLHVFDQLAHTSIAPDLSLTLMWILGNQTEYHSRRPVDYAAFRRALKFIPLGGYVHLGVLSLLFPAGLDEESVDCLDQIGRESSWFHAPRLSYDGFVQELWKTFMADPKRLGILRLLSEVASTTSMPEIPWDYLDPSKISDARFRRAAVVILLTQKTFPAKASALAGFASDLGDQLPRFLSSAIDVFRERQVDPKIADEFLLELINKLPASESESLGIALSGLDELVRRRKSQLDDPSVWKGLNLPPI